MMDTDSLFSSKHLSVVGELGEGSGGSTFLVEDPVGSQYAVKLRWVQSSKLNIEETLDEESLDRATNEEKCMKALSSMHVVHLHDTWFEDDEEHLCLRMEYCNLGDMKRYLDEHYPLTEGRLLSFFAQLLIGLNHIHLKQIIHRDIKADNIFLHKEGDNRVIAKMGDFGLSKRLRHADERAATKVGTSLYFSPEILDGKSYTQKTDVWSLGVAFYFMMTNTCPFYGRNVAALSTSIRTTRPPHPSRASSGNSASIMDLDDDDETLQYPTAIGDLVMSMLNPDSEERPSTQSLLASPLFSSVLEEWPWLPPSFRHTIGLIACRPRTRTVIRAAPSLKADVIGGTEYADVIFVTRRVTIAEGYVWLCLHSPMRGGHCIAHVGEEPLYHTFQNPHALLWHVPLSAAANCKSSKKNDDDKNDKNDKNNNSKRAGVEIPPFMYRSIISPLFYERETEEPGSVFEEDSGCSDAAYYNSDLDDNNISNDDATCFDDECIDNKGVATTVLAPCRPKMRRMPTAASK